MSVCMRGRDAGSHSYLAHEQLDYPTLNNKLQLTNVSFLKVFFFSLHHCQEPFIKKFEQVALRGKGKF